jgi:hypothetical protein
MKNLKISNFVYLLVGFSAVAWFVLSLATGQSLANAQSFFKLIPNVVTIDLFIILIFTKWLWRWKIFKGWLVPFPNLNGTWIGQIESDWKNPETGQTTPPIPVMLTVKQSLLHISCVMHTAEMKSYSFSEGLHIDSEKQIKQMAYIYTSKPRITINQRSLPHDGAIVFDIIESPMKKLCGRYWTERKTTGEITVTFNCKKILEELPSDLGPHPVLGKTTGKDTTKNENGVSEND